jgi:hypothetical protein
MRLTRRQLRRLIKEEVSRLNEAYASASDVAEVATAWSSTNEDKLIRLIVGSIRQKVENEENVHSALVRWVHDVYSSAGKVSGPIISAIGQAETRDEHVNTIVRMFVDSSAKLTGPLDRSEGSLLRVKLNHELRDVGYRNGSSRII